jgi:atypical dual specificity phosphatase
VPMMFDFDAIDDSILVGSAFHADDVPTLVELGVGAVVSLQAEAPDPVEALEAAGLRWTRVECLDFHAPTPTQVDSAVSAVEAFVNEGRRVYIHCFAGLQRSVTIAACYLIKRDPVQWNANSALERVRSRRRHACPTYDQIEAVLLYDRIVRELRNVR